jgi:hypothetical protein
MWGPSLCCQGLLVFTSRNQSCSFMVVLIRFRPWLKSGHTLGLALLAITVASCVYDSQQKMVDAMGFSAERAERRQQAYMHTVMTLVALRSANCSPKSFGHKYCTYNSNPRFLATYSVLFGHIFACFGHIFCAFWTHICVFRPHILCFLDRYSVLFGHIACCRWLENGHFQDSC